MVGHMFWGFCQEEFGKYLKKLHLKKILNISPLPGVPGKFIYNFNQDNFGRRKTYIITGLLTFVFALSITMTNNYVIFIVLRVFFGLCANGMGSYTLPLELGKKNLTSNYHI